MQVDQHQTPRTPLSTKRANLPSSPPRSASPSSLLKAFGATLTFKTSRLSPSPTKDSPKPTRNPMVTFQATPTKSILTRFASIHLIPVTPCTLPPPPRPTQARHRKRINTTRSSAANEFVAELYFRVARRAAMAAAERFGSGQSNPTSTPTPRRNDLLVLPPTPTPKPGSSPYVKAQRHMHHLRYRSVEVKSLAKEVLRERLVRAREI